MALTRAVLAVSLGLALAQTHDLGDADLGPLAREARHQDEIHDQVSAQERDRRERERPGEEREARAAPAVAEIHRDHHVQVVVCAQPVELLAVEARAQRVPGGREQVGQRQHLHAVVPAYASR